MTRTGSALKLTYEDLLALPEDRLRHELIDGEHYVTPPPVIFHQLVGTRVLFSLGPFAASTGCAQLLYAPVDVVFSPHDVVEPDILFLSREHLDRVHWSHGSHLSDPPDLVIEILSPSTRSRDLGLKRRLYEKNGVPEYWVLDPVHATTRVFRLGPEGYGDGILLSATAGDALTTPFAPGWSLPLRDLFRRSAGRP